MQIDDFDKGRREVDAIRKERPWRKDAQPLGKPPSTPNYPEKPFNYDEWMKSSKKVKENNLADQPGWYIVLPDNKIGAGPFASRREAITKVKYYEWFNNNCDISYGIDNDGTFIDSENGNVMEDSNEIPEIGDTIRTKKMQMEGKVEKLGVNRAGYDEVLFRIEDGRLMKTPLDNVIVIQKLADGDNDIFEERTDEVSTELLTRYKTAAAKDARESDKKGDTARGNKRFSGIVKATNKQFDNDKKKKKTDEGSMGGINRCAPAQDVSYEDILDEVMEKWHNEQQLCELSVGKLQAYKDMAKDNTANFQKRPLRKLAKTAKGVAKANKRIDAKSGNNSPKNEGLNEVEQISYDVDNPPQHPVAKPRTPPAQSPSIDPWHGDPAKQAKAPKSARTASHPDVPFSELVQDTIRAHGVKWAFNYYVKKHGLPPRQFQIFAGLTADVPPAKKTPSWTNPPSWTDPSITKRPQKQSVWSKIKNKLSFEE